MQGLAVLCIPAVVLAGIVGIRILREIQAITSVLDGLSNSFQTDTKPALESARTLLEDASKVVAVVRGETEGLTETSKDVRERLTTLVDRTEERLRDLDALIDVVQYEVEETALDVAAALRTTRRSASIFRTMKRAFLRRGR